MDRKVFGNGILVSAVMLILLMVTSCSVVFEAGISGRVVTTDGTSTVGVGNVNVFAYTSKSLRDADFAKFQAGQITRPSEGAGYVASTTTNANGDFTVNKIVWETKKSDFGKTADVDKLYLIFYNKNYYPDKADATIISGSTNASNVYKELESNKDYATINVTVYDVSTGKVLTVASALTCEVEGNTESDTRVMTGTQSFVISFEKGTDVDVTFKLANDGSRWKMTDSEGTLVSQVVEHDVQKGILNVSLYMKNYEFILPAYSGNIDGSVTDHSSVYVTDIDNIPVHVEYYGTDGQYHAFEPTVTAGHRTYSTAITVGDNLYYTHGHFSGVGYSDSYTINVNTDDYPDLAITDNGKMISVKLRLVFETSGGDKYYEFTQSRMTSENLGHIDLV
ncbi:MAG: hypothetical protein MJ057_00805 [Sphaerochaetaceae bacterium]|nr:hypothetical protein [Sphaerochaetaceae bacterium]